MTTKRIVIPRSDGGVTVRIPCPQDRRQILVDPGKPATFDETTGKQTKPAVPPTYRDETDDEFLARVIARNPKEGAVDHVIVEVSDIPTEKTYRGAWTFSGGKFGHDMKKAKEIHREKIREARAPLLQAQDVEVSKALAQGDTGKATTAEAARQRLRDATKHPSIESAKTIEELKDVWPL